jgi:Leucine-rich repeat (LRR) protein
MSISSHYPSTSKQEFAYPGDAKAGMPEKTTAAFEQWPDAGSNAAALREADALYEARPRYGPDGQVRRPQPAATHEPLIDAYRAGPVDAACLDGRLEDDDDLMLRLARAAGVHGDAPTVGKLTVGQRRRLAAELVCAFTRGIDWMAVLGPDPNDGGAVYYDGLALRNAGGKPLAAVLEGLEARISRVLQARGIAAIAGIDHCAGLARQVRRTLTSDPTLSLQPPPDIVYGGPSWLVLWTGMRMLSEQGLDLLERGTEDLLAVGRAAMMEQARQRTADAATPSGVDLGGLLLMAHAAGRIDLRAVAQGQATLTAEQLTAYYHEACAPELRLLDALKNLQGLKPPGGRQLADASLRAAGIDPDYPIDVDCLVIPAAFGPVEIIVPLPFTLYRQSIGDFYVDRDKLDLRSLPPAQAAPDGTPVPAQAVQARAALGESLKARFDIEFDKYAADASDHIARVLDASVELYARNRGIDLGDASITVSRVRRRLSLGKLQVFAPFAQDVTLQEKDSAGYFVAIDTPRGSHRYFLSKDTAAQVSLPAGVSIEDWCRGNESTVFGKGRPSRTGEDGFVRAAFKAVLSRTYPVAEVASGNRAALPARLKTALSSTLASQRAGAYGPGAVEQMREIERGLVPFRSTYLAIRSGQTEGLMTTVAWDALLFLPALGEGVSMGLRAGEAVAAGIERAWTSAAQEGIAQAFRLGTAQTASYAPALGRQAAQTALAAARAAIVNPMDILAALRGGGRLGIDGIAAVVERLKSARPSLAKTLSEAALAETLERYRVTDTGLREALAKATRCPDGTLPLGSKSYAQVNGDYLELVVDHPTTTRERPIWRVADAGLPGTRLGAPRLSWDKELGAWRPTEAPGLKGGGRDSSGAREQVVPGTGAGHAAGSGLRMGPTDEQLTRFHDVLVTRIQGTATPEQADAVRAALARMQADRRGKALLRAMYAHHELLGEAPAIALRGAVEDIAGPAPKRLATGPVWHMNLDEGTAETDGLVRAAASTYDAMTGLLAEDRAGLRMGRPLRPEERPFGSLLAQGKPPLDPALEAAWSRWLASEHQANLPAAAVIDQLRQQLQQARCYGGQDKLALKKLITGLIGHDLIAPARLPLDRPGQQRSAFAIGLNAIRRTGLSRNILDEIGGVHIKMPRAGQTGIRLRSIPPLPDDVTVLQVERHAIVDWTNLPPGLQSLDASFNDLTDLPTGLPPGLIDLRLGGNRLTVISQPLPPGLKNLNLLDNSIETLPGLPDTLEILDASMNRLTELPARLPPRLEKLTLFRNSLTRLPEALPASLRSLTVSNNHLAALPPSLPQGLVHLDAKSNRLAALPALPDSLEALYVTSNLLQELPDSLPGSLRTLDAASNALRRLPDSLPFTLLDVRLNNNQLTRLPPSINTLTSASISLDNNPISVQDIPRPAAGQFGPRVFFSVHGPGTGSPAPRPLADAVRSVLDGNHAQAASRWQAIEQGMAPGSEEARNMAEFSLFLDLLRETPSYRDEALRAEVRNWLADLSKPERAALRRTTFGVCQTSTATCHDRVAWTLNEVFKARANDDIMSGRYAGRIGDVVGIARQMFYLDELAGIARSKAAAMAVADEVEVYLGLLVKLRPADRLGLSLVVPEMRYFATAGLTPEDLDAALRLVRERERTDFDKFFVTRYEPWQAMLRQKFGARYEAQVDKLNDLPFNPEFKRQVDAKLADAGLAAEDTDARRVAERTVETEMRYRAFSPLTREYLESANVAYRPAE